MGLMPLGRCSHIYVVRDSLEFLPVFYTTSDINLSVARSSLAWFELGPAFRRGPKSRILACLCSDRHLQLVGHMMR